MRITIRLRARSVRRSITPLYSMNKERWFLVPTEYNGVGWHYDWSQKLAGDYRTKAEAVAAKRLLKARQ